MASLPHTMRKPQGRRTRFGRIGANQTSANTNPNQSSVSDCAGSCLLNLTNGIIWCISKMAARNSAGLPPPSPWFHWKPSGMDTAESSGQSADFVTNSISIQLQRGGCGALFPYPLPHPVPTPFHAYTQFSFGIWKFNATKSACRGNNFL